MSVYDRSSIDISMRVRLLVMLIAILFSVMVLRLWYLQIAKGDHFKNLSENNRIRSVYVQAPRGLIKDRYGETLAGNRPAFNIELITEDCPDEKGVIKKLEDILSLPAGTIDGDGRLRGKRRPFEPKLLLKDVTRDMVAKVVVNKIDLPGVLINPIPTRDYVGQESAAHLLGYIREISRNQLSDPRYGGYQQGEFVGQYGIELHLEEMLRGVRGLQRVEVNATGTRISEFSFESEMMGNDVYLTIDAAVQRAAENALKDKKGAVVALDPNTGEVIALASVPGFDPNIFTGEVTTETWSDLVSGKLNKLSNRALQSAYPPGSVFKIVTALAGFSEGVVKPADTVYCPGFYRFAGRPYRCHKRAGHGYVDGEMAMIQSCDVYFYALGVKLGVDTIHRYAQKLGMGGATGLNIAQEHQGIIPSTEWKKNYFRKPEDKIWYPGETLSVAIGQGATMTTPIQIARSIATLVNGGKVLRPQVVKGVRGTNNQVLREFSPIVVSQSDLDQKAVNLVKQGLFGAVNHKRATGSRSILQKFPEIKVAGKTGTAQVVALEFHQEGGDFEDHAWFGAYAPADDPKLVVAVLVENGGSGGKAAAPVAREVFDAFFESLNVKSESRYAGRS